MKRVILTARFPTSRTEKCERTEECDLLDESDPIFDALGGTVSNGFDQLAKGGFVIFEDEDGLFIVPSDDVLNIQVLGA